MTEQPGNRKKNEPAMTARSTARLLAVQAVYQIDMTGIAADRAMGEFIQHRLDTPGEEGEAFEPADRSMFVSIVTGVARDRQVLDEAIGGALDPSWTVDRLESVLLAILRCGVFELRSTPAVPTGAIINEYIDIAHAFYGGKEPALVHAVLDRLGRVLRAEDGSAA